MEDLKLNRTEMYAEIQRLGAAQSVIAALELLDDTEFTYFLFFLAEVMDVGLSTAFGRLETYRSALDRLPDVRCDAIAKFCVELDDCAAKTSARYIAN